MMDMEKAAQLRQYVTALRALQQSVERTLQQGVYEGAGAMAVKSYEGLHGRIAELMQDDFYVANVLALDTSSTSDERSALSRVDFATTQLLLYLEGRLREAIPVPPRPPHPPEPADFRTLGRDISDQILNLTRTTLKRAISGVEVDIQLGHDYGDRNLAGEDFSERDLSGYNFGDAVLTGANLSNANLSGANLSDALVDDANLTGANLSGANLNDASFSGANLEGASLRGANMKDARFDNAILSGALMDGANLHDANFENARMDRVVLNGANLRDAKLKHADLTDASLVHADLRDANLEHATLTGANLTGAALRDTRMPDGQTYERGMDLTRYTAAEKPKREDTHDEA